MENGKDLRDRAVAPGWTDPLSDAETELTRGAASAARL